MLLEVMIGNGFEFQLDCAAVESQGICSLSLCKLAKVLNLHYIFYCIRCIH